MYYTIRNRTVSSCYSEEAGLLFGLKPSKETRHGAQYKALAFKLDLNNLWTTFQARLVYLDK